MGHNFLPSQVPDEAYVRNPAFCSELVRERVLLASKQPYLIPKCSFRDTKLTNERRKRAEGSEKALAVL